MLRFLRKHDQSINSFNKWLVFFQNLRQVVLGILSFFAVSLPVAQSLVPVGSFIVPLPDSPGLRLVLFLLFVGLMGLALPSLIRVVERGFDGETARILAVVAGTLMGYALASLGVWMAPTANEAVRPWFLALVGLALVWMMFIARLRLNRFGCRHEIELDCRALALGVVPVATCVFATMFVVLGV